MYPQRSAYMESHTDDSGLAVALLSVKRGPLHEQIRIH